jgi:putative membrane protein (TIGR04086 family)
MMKILRSIGVVLVGYIIFVALTLAFFKLSGYPPHQEVPPTIMLASIVVGIVAAFLGGYVAAYLAGHNPLLHGLAVGLILGLGAAVSLISTIGHGAIWSQVCALLLMVPAAAIGGVVRDRQSGPGAPPQ